ncbi:MAG TPA: TetR/AcrR family transcriptional regulator [Solirubrobacteraceae bacterium]|jgi:AcrR family transcriptional regulator|nr:TetR/AcrR family transcriptional regulator [Solirubrobacteraceae bacterium]
MSDLREAGARKDTKRGSHTATAEKIMPIYARLPRGPHPLDAPGVAHNQRIRIHGGMIEAVATRGYPQTSVKLVVGLAGVSRRSFYEQFSSKEACFTATFDLILARALRRLTRTYRAAAGDPPERLRAAFRAWVAELEQNPKALRLVLVEAETAGPEGMWRLQRAAAAFEEPLASALARRPPAGGAKRGGTPAEPLPPPVVRAIVGGLRRATELRLLDDDTAELGALAGEMLKWTLLFDAPAAARLRARACAHRPFPDSPALECGACGGDSRRARLLRSAIEVGLREPKFESLSSPLIADGAGLPFEAVTELFADPVSCYMQALQALGDELLQAVASRELVSERWPAAVCDAVERLLCHLASSPARLLTLAVRAPAAGPEAIASLRELSYELATMLTEGAPARARSRIAVEAIAGGVWQIICCEALAGRGHMLPALAEHVSYVVLAPYIGPDAALAAIVRSREAAGRTTGAWPSAA